MKKNMKFVVGGSVIVLAIVYLSVTGFQQDYSYYLTADEFLAKVTELDDKVYEHNFRVAGQVVKGSIDRTVQPMTFEIEYNNTTIPVRYVGNGPVPDTFKDLSQAVVAGNIASDGVFQADVIQAKCASKYEAMAEEGLTKY